MVCIPQILRFSTLFVAFALLAACNRPPSDPATEVTPISDPADVPSALLYLEDGAWHERVDGNTTRKISHHAGTDPAAGEVIAATVVDDTLVVLHSLGRIEQIPLMDGEELSASGFTEPTRRARLVPIADSGRVLYVAVVDDPDGQFTQSTRIGVYDMGDNTARLFPPLNQNVSVLGLSADGASVYLLSRGQDPSYGTVQVLDIESEQVEREVDVRGYGTPLLAPNGQLLVVVDEAGVAAVYDLAEASPASRQLPLPAQDVHVCHSAWSADSQSLYLAICVGERLAVSGFPSSVGLWRFDLGTDDLTQISEGAMGQQSFVASNADQLLFWHSGTQDASFVDMATGDVQPVTLPEGTVPMEPTAYIPVVKLSPDGRWFFVWDYREAAAHMVHLEDDEHVNFALASDPDQPILWR